MTDDASAAQVKAGGGKGKGGKKARRAGKGRGWRYYMYLMAVLGLAIVFLPTTVVIAFGMLPTLVARILDRTKERSVAMCVGAMNIAGCFPFLFELWQAPHTLRTAYGILLEPSTLLVMYSSALVGWIIYLNVPPIVSMFLIRKSENRVRDIERKLEQLVVVWGEEVKNKLPVDDDLEADDALGEDA